MSNPFDDLESDDDDSDEDSEIDATPTDEKGKPQTSRKGEDSVVADPDPKPVQETSKEPTETDPADVGPAFEYSEVRQKPLYARASEWDTFEKNLRTTIAPRLAEEEVVDEETREIHNAVLKLANEEPERIAEIVLEERRKS